MGDEDLVQGVLKDVETRGFRKARRPCFALSAKSTTILSIQPEDIATLHAAGYRDEAIYYAITVCALFNFYNRWIDASGVHAMSDEAHRQGAKRSAIHGYSRSSQPPPGSDQPK